LAEAKQHHIKQLTGSNKRSDQQLWQAYERGDKKDELLVKNQPLLNKLAMKMAVIIYWSKKNTFNSG